MEGALVVSPTNSAGSTVTSDVAYFSSCDGGVFHPFLQAWPGHDGEFVSCSQVLSCHHMFLTWTGNFVFSIQHELQAAWEIKRTVVSRFSRQWEFWICNFFPVDPSPVGYTLQSWRKRQMISS